MGSIKIVLIGDAWCGKTSILQVFTNGKFPEGCYTPTIFENSVAELTYKRKNHKLFLWDTSGQEDWHHIRKLTYCDAEVVVIVCSVDKLNSLDNIKAYWYPEVEEFCPPGVPVLLVANKKDLRKYEAKEQIRYQDGEDMCKEINAFAYLECSALNSEGVQDVFLTAVKAFKTKKCVCSCKVL